jgi:hypothetical protein
MSPRSAARCGHATRAIRTYAASLLLLTLVAAFVLAFASSAFASGRAATGELAFDPCTKCHPVTVGANGEPTKPLPNGMSKHSIEVEVHDILGKGDKSCVVCHDDPSRNPGKLILSDGSLVDITDTENISRVCQRCHFEKYREFEVGIHGKHAEKCSAAGCHNPHTPSWIYVAALPPFQGTGIEVNAVGADREPFTPMASPPVQPEVETPVPLRIATFFGGIFSLAVVGFLALGRRKQ